ncbi:MAG: ankyrin repeat domain-containing protein [Balneolales bacterium]
MQKAILLLVMMLFITTCNKQPDIDQVLNLIENGEHALVMSMLERGYNSNKADSGGVSLLIMASKTGDLAIVDHLLNDNADVNYQTKKGITALMVAAKEGNVQIAEKLLNKGADLKPETSHGWSALVLAARYGDRETLTLLENYDRPILASDN